MAKKPKRMLQADNCYTEYPEFCLLNKSESKFLRTVGQCINDWMYRNITLSEQPTEDKLEQLNALLTSDICNELVLSEDEFQKKLHKIGNKIFKSNFWSTEYRFKILSKDSTCINPEYFTTAEKLNHFNHLELITNRPYRYEIPCYSIKTNELSYKTMEPLEDDYNGFYSYACDFVTTEDFIFKYSIKEELDILGLDNSFRYIPFNEIVCLFIFEESFYNRPFETPTINIKPKPRKYITTGIANRALTDITKTDLASAKINEYTSETTIYINNNRKNWIKVLSSNTDFIYGLFDNTLIQRLIDYFQEKIISGDCNNNTIVIDNETLKRFNLQRRDYPKIYEALRTLRDANITINANGKRLITGYIQSISDNIQSKSKSERTCIYVHLNDLYIDSVRLSQKQNHVMLSNLKINQIPLNKKTAYHLARACLFSYRLNKNKPNWNAKCISLSDLYTKGKYPTLEELREREQSKKDKIIKPMIRDLSFLSNPDTSIFESVLFTDHPTSNTRYTLEEIEQKFSNWDDFISLYLLFEWCDYE